MRERMRIREVIVVEGRYDKNTLSQVVEAAIIPLDGFGIFHNREKQALLRRMAARRGLIVLTDSDGAGLVLRNRLRSLIPAHQLKHAYIPEIPGRERRKRRGGKAGTLGVEGMSPPILMESLRRAGATFLDGTAPPANDPPLTKADFVEWGLSGGTGSARRREALLRRLDLPRNLSANAMVQALGMLYSRQELAALLETLPDEP